MQQKLTQLTEHVWLWPHNSSFNAIQSSVGIIIGERETVLVDAGNSPQLARRIIDALMRSNFPPVSHLIYTHHHWDHTYGACEFQVPVVSHSKCQTILAGEAKKPWGVEYLRQEIARNRRLRVSYTARARAVRKGIVTIHHRCTCGRLNRRLRWLCWQRWKTKSTRSILRVMINL